MHIDSTTHEHGPSGKVYTYEGDFDIGGDAITWSAAISPSGASGRTIVGTIPLTSPALATLAEQVVRDAIVKRIDAFDDRQGAGIDGLGAAH
jgi:hypothetical protein